MQTWENVYVFISSTFNDMHAERDYLVKRVFPELSEWCEERKLRLVDIDLRWGVTEKDSQENKRVVEVCLSNIDRCRPLFLCFLGQRRGWVPKRDDISDATFDAFPKLENYLGSSVTEMEVTHALIDPMLNGSVLELQNRERAFFFMRDPEYLDDITDQNIRNVYTNEAEANPVIADYCLEELKDQVRETGRPTFEYTATWNVQATTPELLAPGKPAGIERGRLSGFRCDEQELSEVVIGQLKSAVEELYPDRAPTETAAPLQRELDEQARFLQFAQEGFIERTGDFDEIDRFLAGDDMRPCAVCAPAGMGKTSYLARLVDRLQNKGAHDVMYRFVGTSEESVSQGSMLMSLAAEITERFGVKDVPSAPRKIAETLPDLLDKAAETAGKPLVVVIDAINQLDTALDDISWIPAALPENVKFLYSFKLGEAAGDALCRELQERGEACVLQLDGFKDESNRRAVVSQYLSLYLKELDDANIDDIVTSSGSDNPLFLKVLLSELRVFGSHEGLHGQIAEQFGTTPQTAFDGLLDRLERDPGYSAVPARELVANLFGWLAHSKNGLEPGELADLLETSGLAANGADANDSVRLILRQLRAFLAKRDKRHDFFYESFLMAARERYSHPAHGGKADAEWHSDLARYFESLDNASERKTFELAYQYAHAGRGGDLVTLLTSFDYLERRIHQGGLQALAQDYGLAQIPQAAINPDDQRQLALIGEAIEMTAPTVGRDITQLPIQLFGRLMGFEAPLVKRLLEDSDRTLAARCQPWLKPLYAFLPQPGSRIARYYQALASNGAALYRDRCRMAVYCDDDRTVKVAEIDSGRVLRSFPLRSKPNWICLCEDENMLAIREMTRLYFLNLTTGRTYDAEGVAGTTVNQFAEHKGLIVTTGREPGASETAVFVSDVRTGKLVHTLTFKSGRPEDGFVNAFTAAFDQETGLLFMSTEEVGFAAYNLSEGFSPVRHYRNPGCENLDIKWKSTKLFLPEGIPYLVTATDYDGLNVYNKQSGKALAQRRIFNASGIRMAASPDGSVLAYSNFATVKFLSLATFEDLPGLALDNSKNTIDALAFSRDGRTLFVGRANGAIEAWDMQTLQQGIVYDEVKTSVKELHPDAQGDKLVSVHAGQVVVWDSSKEKAAADTTVFDVPVESFALAPDDSFLIASTTSTDGAIYRIEVPSMQCRRLVDSNNSFHARRDAIITCDSKHFGVTTYHDMEFYDCETGETAGSFHAVDALNTGDNDAQIIRNPRFAPASLSIGPRNLTVLYTQYGFLVMQDPDAPGRERLIDAFPGSVGFSRQFDNGTKLLAFSNAYTFDASVPRLKRRDDPALEDGVKLFDLASGACMEHTDDWLPLYLESLELKDHPAIKRALSNYYTTQHVSWQRFGEALQLIRREPGRVIFKRASRKLPGTAAEYAAGFVVWDSTRPEPLCWYKGSDENVRYASDGRYAFMIERNTLVAFSLENIPDMQPAPTNGE